MVTYFEEVFDSFLSKITTFDEYLSLTEEELNEELAMLLKKSLAKFINKKDIICNYDMESFNRVLDDLEIEIISFGMVDEWLSPKINNIELLKQSLSSKDFTLYSQANHLKELLELKSKAESDFQYWIGRYSMNNVFKEGMKR